MLQADLPLDVKLMATATRALVGLFAFICLGSVALWAVRHPVWSVKGISVHGDVTHHNAVMFRAQLATQMKTTLSSSFLTVDLDQVRRLFEGMPWVRQAVVQREFPNRLRVTLREHQPVAWWGEAGGGQLVDDAGEVFDASSGDIDGLPELVGRPEQSARIWAFYQPLAADLARLDLGLERLALDERGSWRATLDNGARIELGRGTQDELLARVARFTATLSQFTQRYPSALESVDLRYPNGYALRMRGVTTTAHVSGKPQPTKR
jgi:cell division protein FtsQ